MKIVVAGAGYVGLANATLLSQKHEVIVYDIDEDKVNKINNKQSPIHDEYIEKFFKEINLNLKATFNYKDAFCEAKYVLVCTPTDFDDNLKSFDTKSIEDIIEKVLEINKESNIVIRSTIPIGYVDSIKEKYNTNNIIYCPEFLREGSALYDNLYPFRIIIGEKSIRGEKFANLLKDCAFKNDIPIKLMSSREAETVKLFSNTYLAIRVSFFNELDSYAEDNNLNSKEIIDGICLDPRIGDFYNNPSFGYGGYCFPKDIKQLISDVNIVQKSLLENTVKSNEERKEHVLNKILKYKPNLVGIYRITMKKETDNYRESAVNDIIEKLKENNIDVIIYEPTFNKDKYLDCKVIKNIDEFIDKSDILVANRVDDKIKNIKKLIYTRDIYNRD